MVDVAHDHDDGRAGNEILLGVLVVVDQLLLDGDDDLLFDLAAHLLGDDGSGVEVDHLAQGRHDAVFHQALDDLRTGLLHAAGQLTHADLIRDLHGDGRLLDDLKPQAAHAVGLLLLALVADGAVLAFLTVAELLAVALLLLAAAAAAALRHVLQLLVVLIQIDVGGLAGIHHLGLGHPAHGLRRGLVLLRLPCRLSLLAFVALLLGGRRLLGLLLLRGLGALGEDHLDAGNLIVLRQMLEDQRELSVVQHLHMVFGRLRILGQDLRDHLRGNPEILGHFVYPVFVDDATQI